MSYNPYIDEDSNSQGRFHVLAEPISAEGESFDIIALHSIFGHWSNSWVDPGTRFSWLRDALPSICPSSRILAYEFADIARDVGNRDADGLLVDLIANRRAQGRSDQPIVFLASVFGGCLAKQLFVSSSPSRNSRPDVHELHASIRGIAYFSTPHRSKVLSGNEESLPQWLKIITLGRSERVNNFQKSIEAIPKINYDFRLLWGEEIPSVCFYDNVETKAGFSKQILMGSERGTMLSQHSEKIPIEADLPNINRFKSANDPNLIRVLDGLDQLLQRAQQPLPPRVPAALQSAEGSTTNSTLRLLCLDGGGVRGLFSILVLERLMEEVHRLHGGAGTAPKPCEFFDLIGGTSTGGLIAIMLGRLQMDLVSCKAAYCDMAKNIFKSSGVSFPGKKWLDATRGVSWFSAEALQAAIRKVVSDRITAGERLELSQAGKAASDAPLLSEQHSVRAKSFVCAIVDESHECIRLRSYRSNSGVDDHLYTIWEAGRATSAAPLYFPPIEIQGHRYYDGGMQSNNPILETVEEAFLLYGANASPAAIVSIGTGKCQSVEPGVHLFGVMKSLASRSTNTEVKQNEFLRRFEGLKDNYFRLQEPDAFGEIDLAASERLKEIEKLAEEYLISEEGRSVLARCAAKLCSSTTYVNIPTPPSPCIGFNSERVIQ